MAVATAGSAAVPIDARPIRATASGTPWDVALARRDAIAAIVRETLEREGLRALVIVSANGNYPPWVRLEAWLPAPGDASDSGAERERTELTFIIDAKPYHEHQLVQSASVKRGKKTLSVKERPSFSNAAIGEWTRYALRRGGKPSNYTPFRDALRGMIHGMLPLIPEPHRNRVDKTLKTPLWRNGTPLLALASLAALGAPVAMFKGEFEWMQICLSYMRECATDPYTAHQFWSLAAVPLGIAGLVAAGVIVARRRQAVSVISQPVQPPRNLGLVDSWHAVIADIGRDYGSVVRRLRKGIAEAADVGVECQPEVYGYRTPNGHEERERLVVSKDQGHVHVHMHPFGNDMFIGWQAFLNWAQWVETVPAARKIEGGQEIEFRELRTGGYIPNQFDLMDLNSLSELVHRRIEREIKAILKEKAIDQQIDFKIIRGDRDRALDKERHKEGGYS